MTRVSKKDEMKRCPRKPRYGSIKSGSKKDNLPKGFKEHANAFQGEKGSTIFIPKIKNLI
ncbi:MAG: hypothetical protein HYZ47_05600 [Simkania negevensis]|nr:hypothetical protein [Simkania negevensis]